MKKLLSVIILLVCAVLFYSVGINIVNNVKENAVNEALNNDRYTEEEFTDFQTRLNNRTMYYYHTLNEEQKEAYTTLYYATLNFDKSCKIKISENDLKTILTAIIFDNSDLFWLSTDEFRFYTHEEYVDFLPEYKYSENEVQKIESELTNKVNSILSGVSVSATDYEKELYFHDYICHNTVYDDSTFKNGGDTAYSSLVDGKSICEGYSRAMQMLLDSAGIKNYLVVGDGTSDGVTEPHMWNIVEIDGKNYHLDVTWDDGTKDSDCYYYFNVTDSYISRDHSNIAPQQNNCIYDSANYFVMNNTYVYSFLGFNSLVNSTANNLANGNNKVEFMFKNNFDYKQAVNKLNDNSAFFDYVSKSVQKSGRNLSTDNVDYIVDDDYNYMCIIFKEV